ncbi:hypothetical protein E3E12_00120 [Formicincola oecophyllae]|uniref:Uncharacterized protein n=1 Tax=Formicincola oecophyllae TaxID=2558361 RepID=A0A4Y6U6U3_9PROT|nr:hypothetical protein [Formicincola oecophyllae]QDH12874.1 hypothetical protein E3E12_00120 [Formicincola oecophyllae]
MVHTMILGDPATFPHLGETVQVEIATDGRRLLANPHGYPTIAVPDSGYSRPPAGAKGVVVKIIPTDDDQGHHMAIVDF